jgi:hypothetical protein
MRNRCRGQDGLSPAVLPAWPLQVTELKQVGAWRATCTRDVPMKPQPLIICAGLLLLGARLSAQSRDPFFTTFSASYDLVYREDSDVSNAGAHFDLAGTVKRDAPIVGIVGEAGFDHFAGATVATVLGGVRLRIPIDNRRILPFVQVLAGLYHCGVCDEDDLALQAGGGVDFRIPRKNFRLRAQLDVRHVLDAFGSFDGVRLSGGIVLPLNSR